MKLKTESKSDNYVWFWLYGYVVCVWFCRFSVWFCCLSVSFQKLCDK